MQFDKSVELYTRALRRIPGGSQTGSKRPQNFAYGAYPIYAQRAEGCRITDVDGNEFIDYVMALGPIVLGYQYPAVDEAIIEQVREGIIAGLLFPEEVELAELMAELVPCAEMVRYFKGGGEATAAAARLVRAHTGREIILNAGYRGWPDVWTAQHNDGGIPKALEASVRSFSPASGPEGVAQLLKEYEGNVAGIFIGVLGGEVSAEYLQAVKELAHQHGALLVYDEIVTGFRLSQGGLQGYTQVVPDVACFAKAMANGMPISAVAGRADVMKTMEGLRISITYGGEAVSIAASIATLKEIRDKNVVDHLWKVGQLLMDGLNQAAKDNDIPFETFGLAPVTRMRFNGLTAEENDTVWAYFLQEMAARGVLLRRGGVNFVTYSHTEADIEQTVNAARDVFTELKPIWKSPEVKNRLRTKPDPTQAANLFIS